MVYNAAIPQATDLVSVSQGQILENFSQLNTQFAIDHYAWTVGTGVHKQVTIPAVLGADPAIAGAGGIYYTKNDPVSGMTQAYFRNNTTVYQITGGSSSSAGIACWVTFGLTVAAGAITGFTVGNQFNCVVSNASPYIRITFNTAFSNVNNYFAEVGGSTNFGPNSATGRTVNKCDIHLNVLNYNTGITNYVMLVGN